MKIKVRPEDFVVREESEVQPLQETRDHLICRLQKVDWDTFGLLDLIARRLRIPKTDISIGGIKDRHAQTEQLISIKNRPGLARTIRKMPQGGNFSLTFLGYHIQPVAAAQIRGNHFTITIRDIRSEDTKTCLRIAWVAARFGVPNYYDEQRFASARHGKGFLGREIFRGSREKALRLYFTPSRFDDAKTRALKSCVLENWYAWERCLPEAFGEYRRILEYLCGHRRAFHKALSQIDRRYLVFLLNAYQSLLFNRILTRYLEVLQEQHHLELDPLDYGQGRLLFYNDLPQPLFEHLSTLTLPVPGWDSRFADPRIAEITAEILRAEGLELKDLKVRQLSRIYINGVERPAIVLPQAFSIEQAGEDELYKNREKVTLKFFLPRGAYATLIVKRLQAGLNARNREGT